MSDVPHHYWDTCVFVAHFNNDRAAYGDLVDHIVQFLDEAKTGIRVIHCSTITIAEVTSTNLVHSTHENFTHFLRDFESAVIPVSPDPNVMALAAELRGLPYTKTGGKRKLATPDAIHLASAITLTETYGVELDTFHTFLTDFTERTHPISTKGPT